MEKFEKSIKVNNGKINYFRADGQYKNRRITYTLFDKEGKPLKKLQLVRDSDFRFSAWASKERNNVVFNIDKDNPLYDPIYSFLDKNRELFDNENNADKRENHAVNIQKVEDKIRVIFTDKEKTRQNDFTVSYTTNYVKDDPKEIKFNKLFDDIDMKIYPRGVLEEIIVPSNVFGKLRLKPEQEEKILKIIPELKETIGFEQNNPWHIYDVWEHTKKALEKSQSEADIRIALLLHDIGKPYSYQDDEDGTRHFAGHALKSAEIARPILERLEYDQKEINDICYMIENHSQMIDIQKINKTSIDLNRKLLSLQYSDAYGYNPVFTKPVTDKLDKVKEVLSEIKNRKESRILDTNDNSRKNDELDIERE